MITHNSSIDEIEISGVVWKKKEGANPVGEAAWIL